MTTDSIVLYVGLNACSVGSGVGLRISGASLSDSLTTDSLWSSLGLKTNVVGSGDGLKTKTKVFFYRVSGIVMNTKSNFKNMF